jgi:hypothetical protein
LELVASKKKKINLHVQLSDHLCLRVKVLLLYDVRLLARSLALSPKNPAARSLQRYDAAF